ncbi:MAG: GIY-YIG nuclease family protein [Bacteroidia bacterium]|nr:GIY-YIG nuclease family protein [Bacteroidia bacterium]
MYAIIDIETTGGNTQSDKITEIALYLHDGQKVVGEMVSLVDPERRIPYYITEMTGITDEMVKGAPKFYELARQIVELTEGAIFVAHNVGFDYNFIRSEFKSLGFDYNRDKLCTVKLSRKLLPGHRSYSLGKLCRELGIELNNRHRAAGDAQATVKLFEKLLAVNGPTFTPPPDIPDPNELGLHPNITKELLKNLPTGTGVYYFYDENSNLIYIGKSKNIRARVMNHLANNTNKKAVNMLNSIAHIGFEETGSELVALLKESDEIKRFKPYFNRAQLRSSSGWGLYPEFGMDGYLRLQPARSTRTGVPLLTFGTKAEATSYSRYLLEKYELCQKFLGLYEATGPCFHYHIHKCKGACAGEETVEEYNQRVKNVIDLLEFEHHNMLVIDAGRNPDERAVVGIENGLYLGWGYADLQMLNNDPDQLKECIHPFPHNRDVQQIIRGYLRKKKVEKVIAF